MEQIEWFKRVTRGDSAREIARRAGLNNRTVARQISNEEFSTDIIIKVAEAYDESPVVALVDLGFMSSRWISEPGVLTALTRASDEQLTDELLRRLRLLPDEPITDVADMRLAQRDGSVVEFDSRVPHAADGSPDERGVDD
ncbi:hypothetical protein [Corynebacterium propinquum]